MFKKEPTTLWLLNTDMENGLFNFIYSLKDIYCKQHVLFHSYWYVK